MAVETNIHENDVITIDIWGALKKHVVLAIIVCLATIAAAAAYTFTRTPQYTATAQLLTTYRGTANDTNANAYNAGASYIQSQIQTYSELVKTEAVLNPVIDELKLNISVSELSQSVTADNPTDTMILSVSAVNDDPEMASKIANGVAASLQDQIGKAQQVEDGSNVISPVKLSIVQKAYASTAPSSPNVKMNLLIGIICGIVFGFIFAVVRDLLGRRIQETGVVQEIVDAPILGTFTKDKSYAKGLVIINEPTSAEADDVRRTCTNLSFTHTKLDTLGNVSVITSSMPSEGKTTVSINLAAAFAEAGSKVLLIDADVRHPSIGKRLNIGDAVGLTGLISGQVSFCDALQKYWKPNLHVLTVGQMNLNPSLLINSEAMKNLLEQASKNYDRVIVDTAPMHICNDAVVLAKEGAGLLLTVGLGVADKYMLRNTLQELKNLDLKITGTIVNFSEKKRNQDDLYAQYYASDSRARHKHNTLRTSDK